MISANINRSGSPRLPALPTQTNSDLREVTVTMQQHLHLCFCIIHAASFVWPTIWLWHVMQMLPSTYTVSSIIKGSGVALSINILNRRRSGSSRRAASTQYYPFDSEFRNSHFDRSHHLLLLVWNVCGVCSGGWSLRYIDKALYKTIIGHLKLSVDSIN